MNKEYQEEFNRQSHLKHPINKGPFSLDILKEVFTDIFNAKPKPKTRTPSITKCEWQEEEDVICWCWEIDTGSAVLYTNDTGKQMFEEAMEKELKNLL